MLPTCCRQLTAAALAAATLAGCEASGDAGGTRTVAESELPFTFTVRSEFTREPVDRGETRGEVVVAFGVSKLDVIAVRRVGDRELPDGPVDHEVRGTPVTSELHRVAEDYAIECQYRPDRAERVRAACRETLESVTRTADDGSRTAVAA